MGSQHCSREEVFSQGVQKNGPSPTDLKEALPSERAGWKKGCNKCDSCSEQTQGAGCPLSRSPTEQSGMLSVLPFDSVKQRNSVPAGSAEDHLPRKL